MLGRISITKQGMSSNPAHSMINIKIEESASGLSIAHLSLTPEMYGMLISGSSSVEGEITHTLKEENVCNLGKELEVKILVIPEFRQSFVYNKKVPTTLKTMVSKILEKGWFVRSYGITSQQTNPKGHEVVIGRYI